MRHLGESASEGVRPAFFLTLINCICTFDPNNMQGEEAGIETSSSDHGLLSSPPLI